MEIRKVNDGRKELCRQILEELPDWFGITDARNAYVQAAQNQVMLACRRDSRDVGMLTLTQHSDWNLEIAVMGVLPSHHRQGVGTALINGANAYAKGKGIKMLSVKTLSSGKSDSNYAMTRAFYGNVGFELFEELPDLWDVNNPCALYVRSVTEYA